MNRCLLAFVVLSVLSACASTKSHSALGDDRHPNLPPVIASLDGGFAEESLGSLAEAPVAPKAEPTLPVATKSVPSLGSALQQDTNPGQPIIVPQAAETPNRSIRLAVLFGDFDELYGSDLDFGFLFGVVRTDPNALVPYFDTSLLSGSMDNGFESINSFLVDFNFGGRYNFALEDARLRPYAEVGGDVILGLFDYSNPSVSDTLFGASLGLTVGAGFEFQVNDSLALNIDYRTRLFGTDSEPEGSIGTLSQTSFDYSRFSFGVLFGN